MAKRESRSRKARRKPAPRARTRKAKASRGPSKPNPVMALELPAPETLHEDIREVFEKCIEKFGFVPNVLSAYSLRPEKLRLFRPYYNELMLGESGLTKLEREMIAVTVSSLNHCYYCLVAHGAAVRELSGDPTLGEKIAMNYRVADLEPRQRAMLDFVAKLTESPDKIGEADRQALRDLGFTDADIFDICEVTGFFNMTNRVASGIDMQPNPEYHKLGR